MPFVKGESLADALRRRRVFPLDEASAIMRQLLDALRAAHDAGIVHRDLKPQNIMLEDRGQGLPNVRLLDFGVAKSLLNAPTQASVVATQAGMIIGTPEYMSPEQISDPTRVDARADLWAVAVTMFEMLTGQLPFPGATPVETISRVPTAPPMPASSFNPKRPSGLDAFFKRALSRNMDDRPRSAAEMLVAIDALTPTPTQSAQNAGFPWPPGESARSIRPGIPPTSSQPTYTPQIPAAAPTGFPPAHAPPPFAPPPPMHQGPPAYGAPPFGTTAGTPSSFGQPTTPFAPSMPTVGGYVPPPPGLQPFPPGNSAQEETEKKIALWTIVGVAITCIVGIVGAALLSMC
jgi:serine/threonine-protein kinase